MICFSVVSRAEEKRERRFSQTRVENLGSVGLVELEETTELTWTLESCASQSQGLS